MGSDKAIPLDLDYVLGPMDVICARGKASMKHPGNLRFRKILESYLPEYAKAKTKMEKTYIVSTIVVAIQDGSPQATFVKKEKNRWYQAGQSLIREKVGQGLRDLLHRKYPSSNYRKTLRRKWGQAKMKDDVNLVLLESNCTDIIERMRVMGMDSEEHPMKTDEEILNSFNEGNMKMLRLFASIKL